MATSDVADPLSQRRLELMADFSPALIWLAGLDKGCTWFNQQWLQFTGRSQQQESGAGWTEGVHPEDRARCLDIYSAAFDRREPFSMEYRLRRHDGQYRWLIDSGRPLYEDGTFTGFVGSCIDITERKQAEARALAAERQLEAVLEGSRAGYLDFDLVKGTAYRSQRLWELTGWPKDSFPATPVGRLGVAHGAPQGRRARRPGQADARRRHHHRR